MSDSILDKQIVLSLNRNWQRIGWRTVKQALISMNGGSYGRKTRAMALDITTDDNGKLVDARPVTWEEWLGLPVRASDLALQTKSGAIRAPICIIAPNFSQMPLKRPRLTSEGIWDRDGGVDQYTGKQLTRRQGNIDHVIPKSRGGKDTWENLVLTDKKLNFDKSNRLNEEVGLKLIRKPVRPKDVPASFQIKIPRHPHQIPFIT